MARDPTDRFEYEIALSFAAQDRDAAEQLARLLTAKDIRVYSDEVDNIQPPEGDPVTHLAEICRTKARYCVLFMSEGYPLKQWTEAERTAAQEHALRDAGEYFLFLQLDDTEIPGIRETRGYRDLRNHSMESIAAWLEEKLAQAKGPPGPPSRSHDLRSGNVPPRRNKPDEE